MRFGWMTRARARRTPRPLGTGTVVFHPTPVGRALAAFEAAGHYQITDVGKYWARVIDLKSRNGEDQHIQISVVNTLPASRAGGGK